MRFFATVLSATALFAAALGLTIDTFPSTGVVAGQTYTITYSPKDAAPEFYVRKGASTNLAVVGKATGTASNGVFTWTVPKDLPNGSDYALEIRSGSQNNYSAQFGLTGGSNAVSSAVSSAAASASSAIASAHSSASAAVSSILSKVSASASSSASAASASASASESAASASRSASARATSSPSSTSSPPASTGAASSLNGSPMAAAAGLLAAFAYLA